jgi:beta-mannosidase
MKKLPYLFFLFLISCFRTETPLETIILLNDGWEFKKLEADDADWRPANVPGTVHTDLLLNGEIEDPFYACNEKELQWIGTNDWIYRKSFYIDDEILINQHITLVFDGLDTYAHVKLNGEIILEANNMFRQWEIDCKKYLVKGENNIEIIFLSAENRFLPDSASYGYPIPGGRWVFARKAAYHFGWDWGPKFVTAGIWKPVYLKIWRNHKINDLHIITNSSLPLTTSTVRMP